MSNLNWLRRLFQRNKVEATAPPTSSLPTTPTTKLVDSLRNDDSTAALIRLQKHLTQDGLARDRQALIEDQKQVNVDFTLGVLRVLAQDKPELVRHLAKTYKDNPKVHPRIRAYLNTVE